MSKNKNRKTGAIKQFINKHSWAITFFAFFIGLILGPGSLWKYLEYGISEQKNILEQVKIENDLQTNLLGLQDRIIGSVKEYIEIRDKYYTYKNVEDKKEIKYQLNTDYSKIKSQMIKLVSDYNSFEAKLSILEQRQPIFFNIAALIPPLPPILDIDYKKQAFVINKQSDEVLQGVEANLKNLFKQYNQKYTTNE
ncbi:MAG: hypothetical protein AABY39_08760 [Nitrospirota bacterium]